MHILLVKRDVISYRIYGMYAPCELWSGIYMLPANVKKRKWEQELLNDFTLIKLTSNYLILRQK